MACGGAGDDGHERSEARPGDAARGREQAKLTTLGATPIPASAHVDGMWGPVSNWPIIPLHTVLLPDGRVLSYGTDQAGKQSGYFVYDIWDPAQGLAPSSHLTLPNSTAVDTFCSSPIVLASGAGVAIAGGDNYTGNPTPPFTTNDGNASSTYLDLTAPLGAASLGNGNNMSLPRWYGTSTMLLNGEILVMGGKGGSAYADIRGLDGVYRQLPVSTSGYAWQYPRNFIAPDGRIFGFDVAGRMYYLNVGGAGSITPAGTFTSTLYEDSTAAMFRPGKILQFGGAGSNADGQLNKAIVIDITGGSPVVTPTGSLSSQRRWVNSTVLPNGKVLATGGSRITNELTDVNNSAETWDPVTGTWQVGASGALARLYHSISMLLPDGSVLVGGGGAPGPLVNRNVEVYYPQYLFAAGGVLAQRPAITAAPTVADIGSTRIVEYSSSRPISRVTLVKTGSVTHSFNFEQRFLELTFVHDGGHLAVQMPTVASQAPPGHYMMFIIDDAGVPSIARIVRMNVASSFEPPAAPTLVQPANQNATAGDPVTLAMAGSDPNGDTLTFSASGLPPGLSIDPLTGVISGIAQAGGTYFVTVSVSDGVNGTSRSFTWTVTGSLAPVSVELAPDAPLPTSLVGASAGFSAVGTGSGIEYSWYFGDGSPLTPWSAAGTANHVYTAPGAYVVTVTVRDSAARTASYSFLQAVRLPATPGTPTTSSSVATETRGDGSVRIWMVNQDNDTVSVFDGVTRNRLAEIAVGKQPRSIAFAANGRAWVTNKGQSSVSLVDTNSLTTLANLPLAYGSRPHGIVMSPDRLTAYIALEATGRVVRVNTGNTVVGPSVDVGPNPRHLSINGTGDTLYVARFVTRMQSGEATATINPAPGGVKQGGEIVVVNAPAMTVSGTPIVLAHSDRPDTEISGRGVPNYVVGPVISPDGTQAWVPSKQDNIGRGLLRDSNPLDFKNTVRAIASRIDLATRLEDEGARVDLDNASVASGAVFDKRGVLLFVALETSREIAVIDAHRQFELLRFDAGRAPQGLALSPDGLTLYVENFMDRTLGAFDLVPLINQGKQIVPPLPATASIVTDKLAANVLLGKRLFYDARDPRLARDRYMSCASCHNDGGADGRVWDLSNMGEGLRRTIVLRGTGKDAGHGFKHWSGNFDEVQDFEGQIRVLAAGTGLMADADFNAGTTAQPLGNPKAGKSADLDALAAYVASLTTYDSSPNWVTSPSQAVLDGKALFLSLGCASCHAGTAFSSSGNATLFDIGTIKSTSGSRLGQPLTGFDPPTLRGVAAQGAYMHDGSIATLEGAVLAHNGVSIDATNLSRLVAYLKTIGIEEASAPVGTGTGAGLAAAYFNNETLSGTPAIQRTEVIDWTWAGVGPGTGIGADNWSVRWSGEVEFPVNGTYRFQVIGDDGMRVTINGQQVVNAWSGSSGNITHNLPPINGTAGQRVPIVVEHFDRTGDSSARLRWLTPGSPVYYLPVPADRLYLPNVPPAVALTAPASATTGTPITLTATASDADGIASVAFYDGATLIGTDATAPYTLSWTPPGPGSHSLTARATDNLGTSTTSAAIVVTVADPNSPPSVLLTAPDVAAVGAAVALVADALDVDGSVTQVDFYDGTTLLGTDATRPFVLLWTPSQTGARSITARAIDNQGASTTSAAAAVTVIEGGSGSGLRGTYYNNTTLTGAPVLARTEPVTFVWTSAPGPGLGTNNWSVRWTGTIEYPLNGNYQLQITSDDGVRVWVDGQQVLNSWAGGPNVVYPLALTPSNRAARSYSTVTIEHFQGNGASTVKLRWKTPGQTLYWYDIPATQLHPTASLPPNVTLSAPAGATVGTAVSLSASATDSDGTVTQVDYFDGTTPIGSSTTSPYTVSWTPTTAGTHALTARATDNAGNQTTSAVSNVNVVASNAPPTITLGSPTLAAQGVVVALVATVGDSDGTVNQVDFYEGTTLLGTDTTSPFILQWTPGILGSRTVTARATDNNGATTTSAAVTVNVVAGGNGSGLSGNYFNNVTLTGAPVLSRTEQINFVWQTSPGTGINADNWSVRWSGAIEYPLDGAYTLQVISDDGIRVWLDGQQVMNSWTGSGNVARELPPFNRAARTRSTIVVEHYDGNGASSVKLRWKTPGQIVYWYEIPVQQLFTSTSLPPTVALNAPPSATVGSSVSLSANAADSDGSVTLVEYFDGATPIGSSTVSPYTVSWTPTTAGNHPLTARATDNAGNKTTSAVSNVNVVTSNSPPTISISGVPALGAVGIAMAITATVSDTDGSVTQVDYYDGATLIGSDATSPFVFLWIPQTTGTRTITARATDNLGATTTSAGAVVNVIAAGTGSGLSGSYFNNTTLTGAPVLTRIEPISYVWADSPGPGVNANGWSVRWTGSIEYPLAGAYTLMLNTDDGARVWLDGVQLINVWTGGGNAVYDLGTASRAAGGRSTIVVEHYDGSGASTVKLRWKTPGQTGYWYDIPAAQLYTP